MTTSDNPLSDDICCGAESTDGKVTAEVSGNTNSECALVAVVVGADATLAGVSIYLACSTDSGPDRTRLRLTSLICLVKLVNRTLTLSLLNWRVWLPLKLRSCLRLMFTLTWLVRISLVKLWFACRTWYVYCLSWYREFG